MQLKQVLNNWEKPNFTDLFKKEIEALPANVLPLQQGLMNSSYVSESDFSIMVINKARVENTYVIKTGVFYTGVIAGCHCADDPSPIDEQTEYCELVFEVDSNTAETIVSLA